MRKNHLSIFIGIAICMTLSGCGKQTLQEVSDSVPSETEQSISDEGASKQTEDEHAEIIFEDAPEGYVYDYQVSMEPIPKEIADLGGPCQGTIHAFPSRIRIGLTEKMMEEDAELKAEVEKRIPEVEQYLKENIGGEFRVDGVDATDEMYWYFSCVEIDTGYRFDICYINYIWYAARHDGVPINNRIYSENYYDKIETEKVEHLYADVIKDSFGECIYVVWVQNGVNTVLLDIIQFTDGEVEKKEEQLKILNFWRNLNALDNDTWYMINLEYLPMEYTEVMKTKCDEGIFYDISINESELLKTGELKAYFSYDHMFEEDNGDSLDDKLKLYDEGKYNEKAIWSYWIAEK